MTQWKQLSPRGRQFAVLGVAASLAVVLTAERDLHRRPAAEVRGNRLVWRVVCLNVTGALAYLKWGRRPEGA